MSYNQSPKNPRGTIYIFIGVVVSIYAFLGGAQIYNESPELCVLFILAVLILYWGMPFFIDAHKNRQRNNELDDSAEDTHTTIPMPVPEQAGEDTTNDYHPITPSPSAQPEYISTKAESSAQQVYLIDCPVCGNQVPNYMQSCPYCGQSLTKPTQATPPQTVSTPQETIPVPPQITEPATHSKQIHLIDCPACGHKVSNYAHACPNCGHPLIEMPRVAPAPSAPTPAVSYDATSRCPICGSTDIKHIDSLDRALSAAMWGIASGKIGKQFKCRDCGHMW